MASSYGVVVSSLYSQVTWLLCTISVLQVNIAKQNAAFALPYKITTHGGAWKSWSWNFLFLGSIAGHFFKKKLPIGSPSRFLSKHGVLGYAFYHRIALILGGRGSPQAVCTSRWKKNDVNNSSRHLNIVFFFRANVAENTIEFIDF